MADSDMKNALPLYIQAGAQILLLNTGRLCHLRSYLILSNVSSLIETRKM